MNDLDLRTALHRDAELVGSPSPDLLDQLVQRRRHQQRQRAGVFAAVLGVVVIAAGIPVGQSLLARSDSNPASETTVAGVYAAVERIGFPVILKPIAGAGSADTHRVDSYAELAEVLPAMRHVPEVSVEEFVDGEEFTYDTICAGGEVLSADAF